MREVDPARKPIVVSPLEGMPAVLAVILLRDVSKMMDPGVLIEMAVSPEEAVRVAERGQ